MKIKWIYAIGCMVISCPTYAKTPSFVGDLVARDLMGLGPVGHVGLASAPDHRMRPTIVLEAMDSAPHIQQNTIDDFKSRSKFWGSKGGLVSPQSIESFTVANRIVRQYYACPEYTIMWKWKEGHIDSHTKPISCAQFRCDTLINYAYAFNEGYSLPTYNTIWTTPLAVYNYFPSDTDLIIPERSPNQLTLADPNKINDNISSINENNLKELNDENFYQMLQNSPKISKKQIRYLWGLFTSNEVDNNIKILFYDFISFENPNYLTNEIIEQAKKEHGELRHKLLVTLQSIYQKSLEKNEKFGLKEITNYFKELQLQSLNKNDGGIVYRGLAILVPKHYETKKAKLTNMDKIHISILSIESDRSHETEFVNDIIYNLDHPDDSLVITASYQYFTQLLINSDLNFFSNESKQLFREHLDKKSIINHNQSMVYPSAYIEFKSALNASKLEEIPALSYDYIRLLAPDIQEAIFNGFTDFTRKRIKNDL